VLSVAVPLVLYGSIGLFTVGWALALMFFEYSPSRAGGPILGLGGSNPFIGLEHFRAMISGVSLEARLFRTSLGNTLIFAFAVMPLNLLITLPLAALIESVHDRLKTSSADLFPARGDLFGGGGADVAAALRPAARDPQ
jgi:ABC-type sugar transport system permease subunit